MKMKCIDRYTVPVQDWSPSALVCCLLSSGFLYFNTGERHDHGSSLSLYRMNQGKDFNDNSHYWITCMVDFIIKIFLDDYWTPPGRR